MHSFWHIHFHASMIQCCVVYFPCMSTNTNALFDLLREEMFATWNSLNMKTGHSVILYIYIEIRTNIYIFFFLFDYFFSGGPCSSSDDHQLINTPGFVNYSAFATFCLRLDCPYHPHLSSPFNNVYKPYYVYILCHRHS